MLITNTASLNYYCQKALESEIIAFDTEFMRDKTYYPKLSLVQIATQDCVFVVDMMLDMDYSVLRKVFQANNILKVIHSARQDLELLYNFFGFIPQNIFDTQAAAMFLGYKDYPSFELLVAEFIKEKVCKELQYSNWLTRPLSDEQINYAIMDATLLYKLFFQIKNTLEAIDRFNWALEESNTLQSGEKFLANPKNMLMKFTNFFSKEIDLVKCYRLILWREEQARAFDIPRSHLLKDDAITALCKQKPNNIEIIDKFKLNPLINAELRKDIIEIIHQTVSDQERKFIKEIIANKKSSALGKNNFFLMLKLLVEIVAKQINIQANLVANTNDILSYVHGLPSKINQGWRQNVIGSLADSLKHGDVTIGYKNGDLFIDNNSKT